MMAADSNSRMTKPRPYLRSVCMLHQGGDWCERLEPVKQKGETPNWSCTNRAETHLGSSRVEHKTFRESLLEVIIRVEQSPHGPTPTPYSIFFNFLHRHALARHIALTFLWTFHALPLNVWHVTCLKPSRAVVIWTDMAWICGMMLMSLLGSDALIVPLFW